MRRCDGKRTATGKLSEVLGVKSTSNLEKELSSYLLALPHPYWFFFYCPQLSHSQLGFRYLNSDICTVECLQRDRKLTLKSLALFGQGKEKEPDHTNGIPHGFHFRISSSGFARKEYLNSAAVSAIRKFKHLLIGLLIDKKIEIGFSGSPFGTTDGRLFLVDRKMPSRVQEVEIPENFRRFLGRVKLPPKQEVQPSLFGGLLKDKPETPDQFIEKVSNGLSILLDSSETDEDIECIRTSSEWLFDAKLNEDDPSLKVMQLAAAAEAVLAEGKKIESQVTKTLSDRCAYLLGYNAKQRANIRKGFSDFYNIRSSLVHGRSRLLSQKDQNMIDWAESIIESIIKKETMFLARRKQS